MSENYVEFNNANCIHQTKTPKGGIKAIRVKCAEIGGIQWIPFWAVHDDSPVWHAGDRGKIMVDYKFARDNGWVK